MQEAAPVAVSTGTAFLIIPANPWGFMMMSNIGKEVPYWVPWWSDAHELRALLGLQQHAVRTSRETALATVTAASCTLDHLQRHHTKICLV